jgi:2-iminobutanoate/2-iminopropanoate deaminase
MKEIRSFNPPGVPQPIAPYSTVTTFGDLVFLAGHLAIDLDGKPLAHLSAGEQTAKAMDYMSVALRGAESDLKNVLKVTIYVSSIEDFAEINRVYETYFPSRRPSRATVEVSRLIGDLKVEIDAIAVRSA